MLGRTPLLLVMGVLLALYLVPGASAAVAPTSISPDIQVTTHASGQLTEDFKSPSVASNPTNPAQVVIASRSDQHVYPGKTSGDFACQIQYSTNGGATWAASTFPPPSRGTCWAPAAAFDDKGNVYVTAQNRPPTGVLLPTDIIVWKSGDGGQSFAAPVTIPASADPRPQPVPNQSFSVQAAIAVDNNLGSPHHGRIYVTWHVPLAPSAGLKLYAALSFSDDGGATWSPAATRYVAGQRQNFPYPAVGPDGTVYVVFKDSGSQLLPADTPNRCVGIGFAEPGSGNRDCPIRVLRSSNGGVSFDADPFTVATAHFDDLSVGEQAGITTTPSGTLLVTYASLPDLPTPAGCTRKLDSFVVRSTNKGETWSSPVRVNDDACNSAASQRDPWVSVAPNGRVDTIFYDDRNDPNHSDGKFLYDTYYANSTDDGQSFGPNVRVTDQTFDATAMFTPRTSGFQSNEFDTQNGIVSRDPGVLGAWGDTRNDTGMTGLSDVFAVGVGFGAAGGTGGTTATPGSGLTATGTGTPDTSAPRVSSYGLTNNPFVVGGASTPTFGSAAKAKKHKKGTTFRYTLSKAATVKITIAQRRSGRRRGKRCVAPTRKLRKAKKCTRITIRGTLTRTSHQGANRFAFSGRISSQKLSPGSYQATLVATDPSRNTSTGRTISFTIVKR